MSQPPAFGDVIDCGFRLSVRTVYTRTWSYDRLVEAFLNNHERNARRG